jgi:hypothetical protein
MPWANTNYQSPLDEASKGDEFCDNVRCDPKLTEGKEMVRTAPRRSSTETFSDWYEALIGKAAVG